MGIVQGGAYEDLRKKSSKFIGSLDFGGFGIGGSFGEKEMGKAIGWAISGLPEEKPRHLLGVGKVRDIFIGVENGIDLFDCVIPTREGRHGAVYTEKGRVAIQKTDLAELYKKNKLKAQKMAVMRNIAFFKNLLKEIRVAIEKGEGLGALKKKYKNYL
jgi:queuine/archaeosine tRNA-ribosyltransferase